MSGDAPEMRETDPNWGPISSVWFLTVWLMVSLLAVMVSPLLGLAVFGLVYLVAILYGISERKREKMLELNATPPLEPLPPLQPTVYLPLDAPVAMAVAARNPTPQFQPVLRVPVHSVGPSSPPVAKEGSLTNIQKLYKAIYELIVVNERAPVVEVIGRDILKEAEDLVKEAERVEHLKQRLYTNIAESTVSDEDVQKLETQANEEQDDRLRRTLHQTLATKKTELGTVHQMIRDKDYQEALLSQAEASLSELRSRLAWTISRSTDFANADEGHSIKDASADLRSLSETMRQTVNELDA